MSDDSATSPESTSSPAPAAETAPRTRRISNVRPKKQAKAAKKAAPAPQPEPAAPAKAESAKFPEFPEPSDAVETPASRTDWPEPEAASSGASASPENPKRKRRRKKGKGNGTQNAPAQAEGESAPPSADDEAEFSPQQPKIVQPPRQNQAPRPKLDAETLSKCAWKIYLAEISEEGVALVGDSDAKELARRCFRLAEIFLEEQSRRR